MFVLRKRIWLGTVIAATLTGASAGIVDTSFNPSCGGSYYTTLLAIDDEGRYFFDGLRDPMAEPWEAMKPLMRLNPDGSVDPTFVVNAALEGYGATAVGADGFFYGLSQEGEGILQLRKISPVDGSFVSEGFLSAPISASYGYVEALDDGRLVVSGGLTAVGGSPRAGLAVFGPDGALSPLFGDVVFDFGAAEYQDVYLSHVDSEGRFVIIGNFVSVNGSGRPGWARFSSAGALLPALAGVTVEGLFGTPYIDVLYEFANGDILITGEFDTVDGQARGGVAIIGSDGSLSAFSPSLSVIAYSEFLEGYTSFHQVAGGGFRITGLLSDGQSEFIGQIDEAGNEVASFPRISRGGIYQIGEAAFLKFEASSGEMGILSRIHSDGSADASFTPVVLDYPTPGAEWWEQISPGHPFMMDDGRILFSHGRFDTVNGAPGYGGNLLLTADGRPDGRFRATLTPEEASGGYTSIYFEPLPGGQLLGLGDFASVAGVPTSAPGIVRLNLPPVMEAASYSEYAVMAFPAGAPPSMTAPDADYNADGVPNVVDFASGDVGLPIEVVPLPDGGVEVCFRGALSSPGYTLGFERLSGAGVWSPVDLSSAVPGPPPASPYAQSASMTFPEAGQLFRAKAIPAAP